MQKVIIRANTFMSECDVERALYGLQAKNVFTRRIFQGFFLEAGNENLNALPEKSFKTRRFNYDHMTIT